DRPSVSSTLPRVRARHCSFRRTPRGFSRRTPAPAEATAPREKNARCPPGRAVRKETESPVRGPRAGGIPTEEPAMTAPASPQGQHLPAPLSRRDWLGRTATGFAGLALGTLLAEERAGAAGPAAPRPHFAPRARAVIQLFQHGGPSHVDLLDPKPEL